MRPASESETLGGVLPPSAVGHFGFTGTSLWIDPSTERIFVLLTNRVHPGPNDGIVSVRREFHRLAAAIPVP
jgi:CubicO group peptidase (beta-lactamase class C family)